MKERDFGQMLSLNFLILLTYFILSFCFGVYFLHYICNDFLMLLLEQFIIILAFLFMVTIYYHKPPVLWDRSARLLRVSTLALALCAMPRLMMAKTNESMMVQQTGTVHGTVVDQSGEPLIGVSVLVKGTTTGTVTDLDGNFSLEAASGKTLVVSYVGYRTQEIVVMGSSQKITLREDQQNLDELVVIGYGTQKKANLTGSVANVDNKLLENRPLTNLLTLALRHPKSPTCQIKA